MPHATDIVAYAYRAALWCPECANSIAAELLAQGKKNTGDTSDWPQPIFASSAEFDTPRHCDAGPTCINAETLSNNAKVGCLLDTDLTEYGRQYVLERIIEDTISSADPRTNPRFAHASLELWSPHFSIPIPPGLETVAAIHYTLSRHHLGVSLSASECADLIAFYEQQLLIDFPDVTASPEPTPSQEPPCTPKSNGPATSNPPLSKTSESAPPSPSTDTAPPVPST